MRSTILLGPGERIPDSELAPLAISPDGTHLVYVAIEGSQKRHLYLRSMDSSEDHAIPGTEEAAQQAICCFIALETSWLCPLIRTVYR